MLLAESRFSFTVNSDSCLICVSSQPPALKTLVRGTRKDRTSPVLYGLRLDMLGDPWAT